MTGLVGDRRGNVMILAAAGLAVLVGATGLATDTVQWSLWRHQLQRQADSAALAGAYADAQGKNVAASATADLTRNNKLTFSSAPVIENAPTVGAYAGNMNAVRVVLQTSTRLPFSGLFMAATPVISTEATAAVVQNGDYCVIALARTNSTGITMSGNATVNMGCGMASNTTSNNAVYAGGSSNIYATPIAAVGGLAWSSNYQNGTTLQPYSLPQPDPYSGLPQPDISGMKCNAKLDVSPNTVAPAASAGCYGSAKIQGTITLNPGVYYIDSANFSVGSQATITGTGVTIILTSANAATQPSQIGTVSINGGATLNLSAPSDGTYAGVLFYQDRRAVDSGNANSINTINGNASSAFTGAFYFPSQELDFSGTAGMNTKCVKMVSKRVTFIGNSTIANDCSDHPDWTKIRAVQVRLVG